MPVILKGIMTKEDAILAAKTGCKGIIVSNHGARQLDTVPATIESLPEIVNAVGSQLTVMMDGGIRNGNLISSESKPIFTKISSFLLDSKQEPMSSKHSH